LSVYDDVDYSSTFGSGGGQSVALEEFDFDAYGR